MMGGGFSAISWSLLRVQVLQVGVAQRVLGAGMSTRCRGDRMGHTSGVSGM